MEALERTPFEKFLHPFNLCYELQSTCIQIIKSCSYDYRQARWGILEKCRRRFRRVGLYFLQLQNSKSEGDAIFNIIRECLCEVEKSLPTLANDVRESYAVVVAAVVLLSYVYLYLTGCGGSDASRAESSGSLDYRDTYIAIVLFRGAYVWIKFRDVASTKRIPPGAVQQIRTSCKDGRIKEKYEPRFKPRKENGVSFNWIYLGRFDSPADAEVVYRMAASCYDYGKGYGTPLDLAGDGRELFTIIPEFTPAEKTLSGKAKQELVKKRVQELYERYKTKKDALNLPPTLPGASLEQELQNRRLQSEILREQQQKEDLARQLQQSLILQQAQQFQIQDLELQVEGLQRQVQYQQAQQNLQPPQQFQVPNLQSQPQLPHLQPQQCEEEPLTFGQILDELLGTELSPEEAEFGAESTNFWGNI